MRKRNITEVKRRFFRMEKGRKNIHVEKFFEPNSFLRWKWVTKEKLKAEQMLHDSEKDGSADCFPGSYTRHLISAADLMSRRCAVTMSHFLTADL